MTTELVYNGPVAGVSFSPAKEGLHKLASYYGDGVTEPIVITLHHAPQNQYDKNAVEVHARPETGATAVFLGHLPRPFNSKCLALGLNTLSTRFCQFTYKPGSENVVGAIIEVSKCT